MALTVFSATGADIVFILQAGFANHLPFGI
jgi:hypothetical protein